MNGDDKKKARKMDIVAWIVASLIFTLAVLLALGLGRSRRSEAPAVVWMGDSIFATGRGEDAVPDKLAQQWNLQIVNASFGGTAMARTDQERWMDVTMDNLSMASLSKAILTGDFSVQKQARIRMPATEYFDEVVCALEKIDFEKVEILFLGYGMNDYQNGILLENPEDAEDEYSFAGALRRVLGDLQTNYPGLRVILLTPSYSWYLTTGKDCEQQDWGGGVLERYVQCEERIAAEYGIEVIDLYHELYTHEAFEDWQIVTTDGVHPNDLGRALLADRIAEYMEEHP